MTTLRLFGPTLDEQDTMIDVTITSVDLDGTVHLAATADDRTWELPLETVNTIRDNNKAVVVENLSHPDHAVWNRLDDLNDDVYTSPFTESNVNLDTKIEDIFQTVIAIMTDDNE